MKSRYLLFLGFALGLIAVVVAATLLSQRAYTYQGSLIDPPVTAADFTLTDQNGQAFTLSQQTGNVVLFFFGFSHCPDECPATLAQFKQIRDRLGSRADHLLLVMITVDPERDTSAVLLQYISQFDPAIIGLTGDLTTLEAVWKAYGITVEKQAPDDHGDYEVEHTLITYAVDKQGRLRLTYPFGFEVESILQDVEHLLEE